jgi:hypothetical protein
MKRKTLKLVGPIGTIIPISMLIQRYFDLPSDGVFGFILPSIAAIAVVGIIFFCDRPEIALARHVGFHGCQFV